MFCHQCGKELEENSEFCTKCGAKTEKPSGQSAVTIAEMQASQEEPDNMSQSAPQPVPIPVPVPQVAPPPTPVAPQPIPAPQPTPAPTPTPQQAPQPTPQPMPTPQVNNMNQQPHYNAVGVDLNDKNNQPMTVLGWLGTFLVMLIPLVNIIMVFVWAFGSNGNRSRKTFFQAYLIIFIVLVILSIVFGSAIALLFNSVVDSGSYY
ncbi:MAG: zinc ribbon domain-containing protein [Vallitaleaceae bacterium]|nr:zinc ribbon domain-containing protein [Vallitaleaceae bacterium]